MALDCANGSSWMLAKNVFNALGAKTYVIHDEPDGLNINLDCGSTHIDALREFVLGMRGVQEVREPTRRRARGGGARCV